VFFFVFSFTFRYFRHGVLRRYCYPALHRPYPIDRSLLLAFRLQFSPLCHVYYRCTNPFQVPCRVRQGRRRVDDDAGRICSVCVQRRLFRGIRFFREPQFVRLPHVSGCFRVCLMPHPPNPVVTPAARRVWQLPAAAAVSSLHNVVVAKPEVEKWPGQKLSLGRDDRQ
jgi:hypothetical protein